MSDTVLYNAGHIEGALATINSLNAQFQDLSHTIDAQYAHLDNVASGQATQAGLEWAQQSQSLRNEVSEITQMVHNAVSQSHEDQIGMDNMARGWMGV
ncbi:MULTISPECIES: hypothetical protein [Mycolicibacter]|uniref:ESAT-6-like protein n=2 Tax=Mycolicibacter TaxID=1073531 RepID=A0ABU5XKZ2_9MYCO|nr:MULTISPECIES: hypothetical protein [unclassified Mycolicibacter]MEB3022927.1 hypothetical protein [Mycolicibacter sp. MYC098]MEB3034978.1 hypothetical protein [Mycolicibacter sp. MYC340]